MERKRHSSLKTHCVSVFVMMVLVLQGSAQLLQTGPSCGQWINVVNTNGGDMAWGNPVGAQCDASDDRATAIGSSGRHYTHQLRINNFGMMVPKNAQVSGIEVIVIRRSGNGTSISDRTVQLLRNGAPVGMNMRQTGIWDTDWTAVYYGGPTHLWGQKWLPGELNHLSFGVALDAELNGPEDRAEIDQVLVTVYYTRGGSTASITATVAPASQQKYVCSTGGYNL